MIKPVLKSLVTYDLICEHNSDIEHKEKQNVDTSVAHMFEKFRTGRIEDLPTTRVPEMPEDTRTDEEMLNDDFTPGLGTDPIELMNRYAALRESLEKDFAEFKSKKKDQKKYKDALSVIDNPQSTPEARARAYQTLDALRKNARAD